MFKQLVIGGTLALASASSYAAQVLIDDFSTAQAAIKDTTVGIGGGLSSSVSGAGILGGERDLFVEALSSLGGTLSIDGTTIGVTGGAGSMGLLSFSNDSGIAGIGKVQWDGDLDVAKEDVDVDGLGSVDLTDMGDNTGFRIDRISADAGFEFAINLWWDSGTKSDTASFTSVGGPGERYIPFTDALFADGADGAVDFADISAIEVIINGPGMSAFDIDLRVDAFSAVPEPGTLSMLSLALFGVYFSFRRKQTGRISRGLAA